MGIAQKIRYLCSRQANEPGDESAEETRLDDLAIKMSELRGQNVSNAGGKANFAPNRKGLESLTKAARDGRIVDRSGEDRAIADLSGYRSIDDK